MEKALILSRMGKYKDALNIYVELNMLSEAEE